MCQVIGSFLNRREKLFSLKSVFQRERVVCVCVCVRVCVCVLGKHKKVFGLGFLFLAGSGEFASLIHFPLLLKESKTRKQRYLT